MMSPDLIERLTLVLGLITGAVTVAVWGVRAILKIERRQDDMMAILVEIKRDLKTLL